MLASSLTLVPANCAEFENLDFESPRLPLIADSGDDYGRVPLSDALRGWTGYIGDGVLPLASFNAAFLSSAGISLGGPGGWPSSYPRFGEKNIIAGHYSAFLQSGANLSGGLRYASASLAQVGDVPLDALSLQLSIDAVGLFSVSLGGQALDLFALEVTPDSTLYGADISAFRGQTTELRITTYDPLDPTRQTFLWLDSIRFSPTAVPEPSSVVLGLAALATFGVARRVRRRR